MTMLLLQSITRAIQIVETEPMFGVPVYSVPAVRRVNTMDVVNAITGD